MRFTEAKGGGDDLCLSDPQSCIIVVAQKNTKIWIKYYYPGFLSHVSSRHFGNDYRFGSIFSSKFQNEISMIQLAAFAANNSPLRPTKFTGVYRYTARYSGTVGYLQGTGEFTSLVTFIVRDTGKVDDFGRRVFAPVTLYPGGDLP